MRSKVEDSTNIFTRGTEYLSRAVITTLQWYLQPSPPMTVLAVLSPISRDGAYWSHLLSSSNEVGTRSGVSPMLAYAHIAEEQTTLKLNVLNYSPFFFNSSSFSGWLNWARRFFCSMWCLLKWKPFGNLTGLELAGWCTSWLAIATDCCLVAHWNRWSGP